MSRLLLKRRRSGCAVDCEDNTMRKFVTITLAVLFAALSTSAMAGGRYDDRHRYDRHDRGHHRDAYLVGGALLGLAAGAALNDRRDDRYYDRGYGDYDRGYGYNDRGYGYYDQPRYGGHVVVVRPGPRYYEPRRYDNYYYAPPRRVIYRDRGYRDHGYRDRGYRNW